MGGGRCHLVDRRGHEELLLGQHDIGYGRGAGHFAQLFEPGGLVEAARTDLDDGPRPDTSTLQALAPSGTAGPTGPRERERRLCQGTTASLLHCRPAPAGGIVHRQEAAAAMLGQ